MKRFILKQIKGIINAVSKLLNSASKLVDSLTELLGRFGIIIEKLPPVIWLCYTFGPCK